MNLPPAAPQLPEARTILVPAQNRLRDAGIDSAALDARLLLGVAIGRDDAVLPHCTRWFSGLKARSALSLFSPRWYTSCDG